MKAICFYFQVHQPFRLRTYRFFDIGKNHYYYDDYQNKSIVKRVADKCYLPANNLFLNLIKEYGTNFKLSFSISGVALEQFEMYVPEVIDSFKKLSDTGCVEFINETYSHSLACLKSKKEFEDQVYLHREKIQKLFGQTPETFRNTELVYYDEVGSWVADMGFKTMLTEGAKQILGWRSPGYVYTNCINPKLKLLLKNYQLSDDIAFRFSDKSWNQWPLTTEKYVDWLNALDSSEQIVNLFMDYETFGEHQWAETGIFEFMKYLPARVFSHSTYTFKTPSEISAELQPVGSIYVNNPVSWADEERDLTAWLGNKLQQDAFNTLYNLENKVRLINNFDIQKDWHYLQTSDHFYYMCTKWFSDGDVHKYFNPYGTPYDAFINYMNILSDFILRVNSFSDSENSMVLSEINNINNNEILNEMTKKSKKSMTPGRKSNLKEKNKNELQFSDIICFSKTNLSKVIKNLDIETIGIALIGADDDIKDAILSNLSQRALIQYEKMNFDYSQIMQSDIIQARKKILSLMKEATAGLKRYKQE